MLPILWVRVNGRFVLYVRQGHYRGLPQMEARESLGRKVGVVLRKWPFSGLLNIGLAQIPP